MPCSGESMNFSHSRLAEYIENLNVIGIKCSLNENLIYPSLNTVDSFYVKKHYPNVPL